METPLTKSEIHEVLRIFALLGHENLFHLISKDRVLKITNKLYQRSHQDYDEQEYLFDIENHPYTK